MRRQRVHSRSCATTLRCNAAQAVVVGILHGTRAINDVLRSVLALMAATSFARVMRRAERRAYNVRRRVAEPCNGKCHLWRATNNAAEQALNYLRCWCMRLCIYHEKEAPHTHADIQLLHSRNWIKWHAFGARSFPTESRYVA